MVTTDATGLTIEQAIERRIADRTSGRVKCLEVHANDGRVRVHGYASSYYVKQLALHAVHEALGGPAAVPVQVDIEVV